MPTQFLVCQTAKPTPTARLEQEQEEKGGAGDGIGLNDGRCVELINKGAIRSLVDKEHMRSFSWAQ
ncbi:unnamed protein product [Protopolystoma xenopodis]|uniref:Uncharacterized protein n=1 Tax=Protopolystoma xenopodis TaxID=117903 RepID=A0A448XQP1_9PLAT|nr:unnamed protein product [Protopolystoma xenopodis]